ncbi:MAG: hypothetical protein A4E65_02546 [Syntrophorhabdus sp. PtaU1.Bin153]|nr:MAG: hypothetical protein A4E65_02546 [Syntrophorhabdus sp. PtaU1.Bin153]
MQHDWGEIVTVVEEKPTSLRQCQHVGIFPKIPLPGVLRRNDAEHTHKGPEKRGVLHHVADVT